MSAAGDTIRAAPMGAAASPAAAKTVPVRARMWSIRWIVTAVMVLLAAGSVVGVGSVAERQARRALEAEMKAQLLLQARNLAMVGSGALLSSVPEWTLLPVVKQLRERNPYLAFVVVSDRAGVIQADADVRRLGRPFEPPPGLASERESPASSAGESLEGNRDLLVASAPINDVEGGRLGTAWIGLRRAAVQHRLEETRRQQLVALGLFLLVGTGVALLLSSLLLRPIGVLRVGLERIARGDLDTRIELHDRTELGALADVVNRMAGDLKGAQVELVERERIAHEVQLARRIQRSLLPSGRRSAGAFVIEGMQRPAAEVGGDYFQTLDLTGGRLGLVVADVSGKGLGGSLVTAMLHASLRTMVAAHESPGRLLADLDRQICEMLERGTFVTMFYGILDPERGDVTFASAGHNPTLVIRAPEGIEWIQARGTPLGALRSRPRPASYQDVTVSLEPGDMLIQYTDGIHEAFAPGNESAFGLDRMASAAARSRAGGCRRVLDALSDAVDQWRAGASRHDDETLLVASRELDVARNGAGMGAEAIGLACVTEALARGQRLTLPASMLALVRIDDWLRTLPVLSGLTDRPADLLRLALHEACANVIEHACGKDPTHTFDLWWVPDAAAPSSEGVFVLRDRGLPFRYQSEERPRLEDPKVRKRGRGFGLEIVRRVMKNVSYHPETPEGNVTRLAFDTGRITFVEEGDGHEG